MTVDDSMYSVDAVAAALGVKRADVASFVELAGIPTDTALSLEQCAALGAVVTMRKKTGAPQGALRTLLAELLSHDRALDDWMVVKRFRNNPTVEKPPLKIDVTVASKARPTIYDPLTLLKKLQGDT